MKPSYLKTPVGKASPKDHRTPMVCNREGVTVYLLWDLTPGRVHFHDLPVVCVEQNPGNRPEWPE